MRIGIAQLWQETNTFNPLPTTRREFEEFGVLRGAAILEQLADTNEPGGFIQALAAWPERPEIVGLVRLPAWPSGVGHAETFDWLRDELTASRACRPAGSTGCCWRCTGRWSPTDIPTSKGTCSRRSASCVGPRRADRRHARPARQPHPEDGATRRRAGGVSHGPAHRRRSRRGSAGPRCCADCWSTACSRQRRWSKIPMVVPAERANTQDPASVSFGLRERLQALESRRDVLSAGTGHRATLAGRAGTGRRRCW